MIPIPSVGQIRNADQYTIEHEPISSIDLMERASRAFVSWFESKFKGYKGMVTVICGPGNNGGDGLCVARLLQELKYSVKVYLLESGSRSADCESQKKKLEKVLEIDYLNNSGQIVFSKETILIDAIFGSGLSRTPKGLFAEVIEYLNSQEVLRISIDAPSGMFMDEPGSETHINSDYTVTFQYPKKSFLLPGTSEFAGELNIVDIGLLPGWKKNVKLTEFLIEEDDILDRLKPRSPFGHKGDFGHALLIGGSYGKMGAMVLSASAALRAGVGKLTAYIPDSGNTIMQTAVPEAMTITDIGANFNLMTPPDQNEYSGIGIGPGLGMHEDTFDMMGKFLQRQNKPMVVDADALNILAVNKELIEEVPGNSIFTPHPGEFKRLVGSWDNDFDKLNKQKEFSEKYGIIVILKGKYTTISSYDRNIYFNPTGNSGMATAGSGDVLTGIITSLLSQGHSSLNAAMIGVYVHGLAGDFAADSLGRTSLIAGDIIDYLPDAFMYLTDKIS